MSLLHRYRDFGETELPEIVAIEETVEASEEEKLEAFENGYKAGWDDAMKAQADSVAQVSAELGQNLQDMSFTYHEALSKLTISLKPIMNDIVEKLLPSMAHATLAAQINEQIMELIKENPGNSIDIVVAPHNTDLVAEISELALSEPFNIVGEATLGEGQAFVRVGSLERSVDLDAVISKVGDAITSFFHEAEQETSNG
ncbi:ABC transporter ATP-binding protein [uncultured Roseobacter sp.]|uniref:ABC transporter ATP-binding protein n=1 Tax=uncultured Roseobacter sp. TaxID=114847 RepID=UPI002624107D|nr:ABC transporter ATP-binding protein [uncultured Roseobacter sp.]